MNSQSIPELRSSITVIVPALNEEANLGPTLDKLIAITPCYWSNWEILVFNDGSTDNTGYIADAYAQSSDEIRAFHHLKPLSLGGVFRRGLREARFDYVIMIHGENDVTTETLHSIFSTRDVDLVIPFQTNAHQRSRFRRLLSRLFVSILNATFRLNLRYYNHYVLYRRAVLVDLTVNTRGFAFQAELLIKLLKLYQCTYCEIPVIDDLSIKKQSTALKTKNILSVCIFYFRQLTDIYLKCQTPYRSSTQHSQNLQ